MKQYLMGFITAICLTTSGLLFMGSQNNNLGDIVVQSISVQNDGKEVAWLGTNENGGLINILNSDGKRIVHIGANNRKDGKINVQNKLGYNVISMGAHRGDGFSGNGSLTINNQNGEYGWSVIGEVSPEHYK
jgi:hypothetical protein